MKAAELRIADIRRDGGTQFRAGAVEDAVLAYAEAIAAGAVLPPVDVFQDEASVYWLADGFQRVDAHLRADKTTIKAIIRPGTRRDAVLHACGANTSHGLRRTNEDKRRAVAALLGDPEWSTWSDRKVADVCRVSHPFVGGIRNELTGTVTSDVRTYTTKHGTDAVMDTGAINASRKKVEHPAPATAEPGAKPILTRMIMQTNGYAELWLGMLDGPDPGWARAAIEEVEHLIKALSAVRGAVTKARSGLKKHVASQRAKGAA